MKSDKYPYVEVAGKNPMIKLVLAFGIEYHLSSNMAKEVVRLLNAGVRISKQNKKLRIPLRVRKDAWRNGAK